MQVVQWGPEPGWAAKGGYRYSAASVPATYAATDMCGYPGEHRTMCHMHMTRHDMQQAAGSSQPTIQRRGQVLQCMVCVPLAYGP